MMVFLEPFCICSLRASKISCGMTNASKSRNIQRMGGQMVGVYKTGFQHVGEGSLKKDLTSSPPYIHVPETNNTLIPKTIPRSSRVNRMRIEL